MNKIFILILALIFIFSSIVITFITGKTNNKDQYTRGQLMLLCECTLLLVLIFVTLALQ